MITPTTQIVINIVIALIIIVLLISYVFDKIKDKNSEGSKIKIAENEIKMKHWSVDQTKTIEELRIVILTFVQMAYENRIMPLARNYDYRDSKREIGELIKQEDFNQIVLETSLQIIDYLSEEFKEKCYLFINEERFEDFIALIVNQNLLTEVIKINKEVAKRFNKSATMNGENLVNLDQYL